MKEALRILTDVDRRAAFALVYTAFTLTILEYGFFPPRVEGYLQRLDFGAYARPSLAAGVIWSAGTSFFHLVVPVLIVLLVHREPLASIGFRAGGFVRHVGVYLALFVVVMLPVIAFAASQPAFQETYPFVRAATADLGTFVRWELAYLAQFVALEAFFRGYLLFTLERAIGGLAIWVMAIPYCMIHFHKPPLEALAAIVAGLALGALALRYRSWYGGALLHGLVALTMDALSAHRAGLF